jgi:transcriptional regulator with XRE-family HTH domain
VRREPLLHLEPSESRPARGEELQVDPKPFLQAVGRSIASRRRTARLTQEQVAERIGSSSEWISQVERGIGQPSVAILVQIAEALGVTVADIFADVTGPRTARPSVEDLTERVGRLSDAHIRVLVALADALEREVPGGR